MVDSVLRYFYQISEIPRCSKNEDKIINFLQKWAKSVGFDYKTDRWGNTLIFSNSSKSRVILQSHVDMVCEKSADSLHDFSKEPIPLKNDGVYIYSDGTSLGADNGIGMAISMFVKEYFKGERDDIALLFTVDEETGLNGAKNLDESFLSAEYLINIDSEEDDTLIVGCAGGADLIITRDLVKKEVEKGGFFSISIDGFSGGHSGIDIDKGYGNPLKILVNLLNELQVYDIVEIHGGTAHNAIPRTASAVVSTDRTIQDIKEHFYNITRDFKNDKPNIDVLSIERDIGFVYDMSDILPSLSKLNHGVFTRLNGKFSGVESSSNFAKIEILKDANKIKVVESLRSSSERAMGLLKEELERYLNGFQYYYCCEYPGWEPSEDSQLLKKSIEAYEELFGSKPKVEAIHAGLECGIFKRKNCNLDIISLGPNVFNPHSPFERLEIRSVDKITKILIKLINKS